MTNLLVNAFKETKWIIHKRATGTVKHLSVRD